MFQVYGIQLYCPPSGEYLFIPIIDFIFPIFGKTKKQCTKQNKYPLFTYIGKWQRGATFAYVVVMDVCMIAQRKHTYITRYARQERIGIEYFEYVYVCMCLTECAKCK